MNWTPKEREAARRRAEAVFIGVSEWDDDVRADVEARGVVDDLHHVAEAMLDFTAELLAARGGTMTAEELVTTLKALHQYELPGWVAGYAENLSAHTTAQGAEVARLRTLCEAEASETKRLVRDLLAERAEVATLRENVASLEGELARKGFDPESPAQAEINALRAELERLKPSGQVAELAKNIEQTFHTFTTYSDAARQEDLEDLSRLAALAQQGQEATDITGAAITAAAELRHAFRPETRDWNLVSKAICILEEATTPGKPTAQPVDNAPWRCAAGTCAHDDAKEPGHAERVAARSQAFNEAAAMHPNGRCTCAGEGFCHWCGEQARAQDAYDRGAEAMRAACWVAVQPLLQRLGLSVGGVLTPMGHEFKTAIDGAAP